MSTVRWRKMRLSFSSFSMSFRNGIELLDPAVHRIEHAVGQVLVNAAGPEIGRVHARAAHLLVVLHQQLALLEAPQRRRQRADVHGERRDVQQMIQDARDLGEQHADVLAALRRRDAQQLLDRQRVGVLLVHRRDVVEPVEVRHRLQVALVLDQLLGAAMQQADMRIAALDDLAVHLDDQAQHAVGRRVLRPEVHRQGLDLDVGHVSSSWPSGWAFSSPGSTWCAPSHGLRKSKRRNSCVSFTGS